MISIGFRAEPIALNWAVVEGTKQAPILVAADTLKAPQSFDEAQALGWFRVQAVNLFDRFAPSATVMRYPEMIRGNSNYLSANKRCRVEGVAMEVANSKGITVHTGALVTISKNLGTKGAKRYLEHDDLRGLKWADYSNNCREAIMVAVSGLPEN